MKKLLALALPLLALVGCEIHPVDAYCHYNEYGDYHCHDSHSYDSHVHVEPEESTTTIIVATAEENSGGSNNNIIVIEEEPICDIWEEAPLRSEPDWCSPEGECEWYVGYGCFEVWAWSEWDCHWYYQHDYCIY